MNIEVKDFQAIGDAKLTVEGLTVIVGPSDRGKSALLRAIESALFNRVGDGFVRLGQSSALVTLALPGPHEVVWEKGGGKNRFRVDGTDYAKVGREAPQALRDLGFRDEVIGGRVNDNGKLEGGETMRPQVARQFDPIFLLDRPGSFLNETMVKLSRLGVLQRANRACSADLRVSKIKLQVQQDDAQQARAAADALAPVVPLRERVGELVLQTIALQSRAMQLARLQTLLLQRRLVTSLAGVVLPDTRPTRALAASTVQTGVQAATLRSLLAQQAQSRARITPLPEAVRFGKPWWKRAENLQVLRTLTADRARVLPKVRPLPAPRTVDREVTRRLQLYQALLPRWVVYKGFDATLRQLEQAAGRAADEHTKWEQAFADFKKKVRVCPVCDKPFKEPKS